jgi:hypothetical protein
MGGDRTTEQAENSFEYAFRFADSSKQRNQPDGQYQLYMAMGMQSLAKAIRQVYDKLEELERKMAAGR